MRPQVRIARVRPERDADLPVPAPQTPGAVGVDLPAAIEKDLVLRPGERARVPTGFAVAIPEGYEGQLRPRSGLVLRHGVTLLNAPGTIDADYRGEVKVILMNLGGETVNIDRGDRIAQLVIAPVTRVVIAEVDGVDETTRGEGGFGSTGTD